LAIRNRFQPIAAGQEAPVRAVIVATVFLLFLMVPFAPLSAQSGPPTFLFLLEGRGVPTGTIHVFNVSSITGTITEAPGSPFNAGLTPQSMALDATGRFLYVANMQSDDVTGFSVDPVSGALTELPGSPYFIGSQPLATGIEPTGRFLYVAAAGAAGQGLFEFNIDGNSGVLTAASGSPQLGIFGTSMAFNPAGNYLYLATGSASGGQTSSIVVCAINFANGALTPVGGGTPASGGSNAVAVSSNGTLLYSVDPVTSGLDAFEVGAAGVTLAETSGSPYAAPNNPFALVVHPSGNSLYVVNKNQQYQANLAPNQFDGSVSAYGIAAGSGALTPVAGSPFSAGINPLSIVVDPTGRFAFVTATTYTSGFTGFAQILCYSIDAVTGVLTPLSGTSWTDSVQSNGSQLAISPGARFATNPTPSIASLSPSSTIATATAFSLQVNGSNFVPGSTVYFGGLAHATTFVSSSELTANIPPADIDNGGTAVVFVFNPLPGGGASTSVEFPVFTPTPVIASLSSSSIAAGTPGFSFDVIGTGFVTSSVINFNGSPLQTFYIGPTVIGTGVPTALISAPGTASITVTNPGNGLAGGGTSNAVAMTILPPNTQPSVTSISPTSATAGGPSFTLTVNGSGFVRDSQVTFNLNNVPTTFVSASQLTANIPASAVAIAGNPPVIVNNPDGFASTPLTFTISNPQPGVGSVTPPSLPAGSNALTLNVTGTGFLPGTPGVVGSQVLVNGSPRQTAFLSPTQLQATLLPADLSQPGTLIITVVNPLTAGGTAPVIHFSVTDFSVAPPTSIPAITAGQTANISLIISPLDGAFSVPVSLSASGLPPNSVASFSPSATIIPGTVPQTVTLAISTMPHTSGGIVRLPNGILPPALLLCSLVTTVLLAGFYLWAVPQQRTRFLPQLLLALVFCAIAGLAACGVAGSAPASAPGSTPPINTATGTPAGNSRLQLCDNGPCEFTWAHAWREDSRPDCS
jgi:6-phosphogluconolactonase (cycloisomerase 2 family)